MLNVASFVAGIVSIYFITGLPGIPPVPAIAILCLIWLLFPVLRLFSSFGLGFFLMTLAAGQVLAHRLPDMLIEKPVILTGTIASLPENQQYRTRFNFAVENIRYQNKNWTGPKRIRLNWYGRHAPLVSGEKWQLNVKLKPARGLANPGGFDYERWLFQNRLTATGYVIVKEKNQRLSNAPRFSINHLRQHLRDRVLQHDSDSDNAALINALLIGDRSSMSESQWQILTATGTNHLLAISGLHIGLIAGLFYWLFNKIFRKTGRLLLYIPAHKFAALMAMLAAIAYAALAGFSIPTQRALVMLTVVLFFSLIDRSVKTLHITAIALLAVLLFDPLSVLSVSFWLSFTAVVIIVFALHSRVSPQNAWQQFGKVQWVVSLALIPMLLFAFQSFSLVAPLANLFAVPWVSFVVVPLVFVSALVSQFTSVFDALLTLINLSLDSLWWVLKELASLPLARWYGHLPNFWLFALCMLGAILLVAPRGLPFRMPGLVLFSLLFFGKTELIPEGGFKLVQLDVGQGLSSVIETNKHILVFDTGARYGDSYNMGAAVIVPYLRTLRTKKIDTLIISHGDNDHIGGMQALLTNFPVKRLLSGVMNKTPYDFAKACVAGQHWQWDGVDFEILNPGKVKLLTRNNNSCVLKVSNGSHSVLLTGDIEKEAESTLLAREKQQLNSDVIVVPHHGSNTSSTVAFIQAVSPQWALFPVGYLNRFRFPRPGVVKRYIQQGSKIMLSSKEGAISMSIYPGKAIHVESYRQKLTGLWHLTPARLF